MTDDQLELVTAYVDGEATADERARVEADAELLAEVERQRAVRFALHDMEPPSAGTRESAIAAALAVFDDEIADSARASMPAAPAMPDVTAPTNIIPFDQRRRMRRMRGLSAAAAVAAVVVAGAVIATRGGDDGGTTADQVRETTQAESGRDSIPGQADAAAQPPAAAEAVSTDDELLMATGSTTQLLENADDAVLATSESEYDAAVAATEPAGAGPAASPPTTLLAPTAAAPAAPTTAVRTVVVITDDDLLDVARAMKEPPPDIDDAEASCADGLLKAEAMYEDEDGDQHPMVVVAVDDDTIGALTLDDCAVALEAAHDADG